MHRMCWLCWPCRALRQPPKQQRWGQGWAGLAVMRSTMVCMRRAASMPAAHCLSCRSVVSVLACLHRHGPAPQPADSPGMRCCTPSSVPSFPALPPGPCRIPSSHRTGSGRAGPGQHRHCGEPPAACSPAPVSAAACCLLLVPKADTQPEEYSTRGNKRSS